MQRLTGPPPLRQRHLPYLFPLLRLEKGGRGHFILLLEDEVIVGRAGRKDREWFLSMLSKGNRSLLGDMRAAGIKWDAFSYGAIKELSIAPDKYANRSVLTIRLNEYDSWSSIVPVATDSLAITALGLATNLIVVETPAVQTLLSSMRLIVRIFLGLLISFMCIIGAVYFMDGRVFRGVSNWIGALIILSSFLAYLKYQRQGFAGQRSRFIPLQTDADKASQATETNGMRRSNQALGFALRMLGAVILVVGLVYTQIHFRSLLVSTPISHDAVLTGLLFPIQLFLLQMAALLVGAFLVIRGYHIGRPDANAMMKRHPGKPILFLRSFGDDTRYTFTEPGVVAEMCGLMTPRLLVGRFGYIRYLRSNLLAVRPALLRLPTRLVALILGRGADTAEEQLSMALKPYGPLIAVGNPAEPLPTPGPGLVYLDGMGGTWKSAVRQLIKDSSFVVIQPSHSSAVWWELQALRCLKEPEKVVVILKSIDAEDVRDSLIARIGFIICQRIPLSIRSADILVFDRAWNPFPLPVIGANPLLWPWLGTSVDLRQTLLPVLSNLGMTAPKGGLVNQAIISKLVHKPMRLVALLLYGFMPWVLYFSFAISGDITGGTWRYIDPVLAKISAGTSRKILPSTADTASKPQPPEHVEPAFLGRRFPGLTPWMDDSPSHMRGPVAIRGPQFRDEVAAAAREGRKIPRGQVDKWTYSWVPTPIGPTKTKSFIGWIQDDGPMELNMVRS